MNVGYTAIVVLVAACGSTAARPGAGLDTTRQVLGAPLKVGVSWAGTCTDWKTVHQGNIETEVESCDEKDFEVQVACSAPCTPPAAGAHHGAVGLDVIPLQLGPLAITVTSTRRDTGEQYRTTLGPVAVVLPDRLVLECQSPKSGQSTAGVECGPEGVSASAPFVRPLVHLGGHTGPSTLVTINGVIAGGDRWISLAELAPAQRVGDGVAPGTYTITLALGTMTERWQVVAR